MPRTTTVRGAFVLTAAVLLTPSGASAAPAAVETEHQVLWAKPGAGGDGSPRGSTDGNVDSDDEVTTAGPSGSGAEGEGGTGGTDGEEGNPVLAVVTSPLWLTLLGGGLALVGAAFLFSRRSGG